MLTIWQNIGTVGVCILLAAIVTLIVVGMVRDKKMGKSSCGSSCGCCPMRESCHSSRPSDTEAAAENK